MSAHLKHTCLAASALLLLAASPDDRLSRVEGQLRTGKDPRVRAQAALVLATLKAPQALTPLCAALEDTSPLVRSAAAKALGTLGSADAKVCLRKRLDDADGAVRADVVSALAALDPPKVKPLSYVALGAIEDRNGKLGAKMVDLAKAEIQTALAGTPGLLLAPKDESRAAAAEVLKKQKLKGFMITVALEAQADGGVRMDALCMTYPERRLIGQSTVTASGAGADDLIRALAPAAVESAGKLVKWSTP
jgi:hypothetical protein